MVHVNDILLNYEVKICNVYGPYANRCPFSDSLSNLYFVNSGDIILGGDLNFTLSLKKIWGQNPRQDPLEDLFSNWMEKHKLIDLEPKKLSHTWSNGRKGTGLVEKRLDCFMIYEGLIEKNWSISSRVDIGGISNHLPIVLEVLNSDSTRSFPIKFNQDWLKEEEYRKMVMES
jgi:hypothetical protein